jgi:hypothetical protein
MGPSSSYRENMGCAVLVDRHNDFHTPLMASLHYQQALFRVLVNSIDVDQFVVDVSEQHHVADFVGEQKRTD